MSLRYKKYTFLKPLWRTLLLHFTIMFYHDSLYCIIPRCLREVWLFGANSMFYCIIFFVKQKTIFFSTFTEMHIFHVLVNNLNTSPQKHLPYFLFVKYCVPGCLGRTLLFGFDNEFYSFMMLPLNSITLLYQNAERINR